MRLLRELLMQLISSKGLSDQTSRLVQATQIILAVECCALINIILYHLFFVSALIQASMHNSLIRYYNVANSSLILWHTHLYLRLKKSLVPFGWVLFLVCTPRTVTKQINITRILAGHVRCTRKHGTTSVVGNITIWYIHYTPHYSPATDSEHVRCRFVALSKCLFLS